MASSSLVSKGLISLVHLPQWCVEQPPLGIAYLTGFLEAKGYRVRQVDYSVRLFAELPDEQKHFLDSHFHLNWIHEHNYRTKVVPVIEAWLQRWAEELAATADRIVGFTVLTTSMLCTLDVVARLKKLRPDLTIVLGGPHCTRYEGGPEMIKHPDVDMVVPDEGEETFHDYLQAIDEGRPLDSVKGLLFKREGQVIDTGTRDLIKDINALPIPVFSGFDLHQYRSLSLPLLGSRGCIYRCSFCSETVLWKKFRYRSGDNMFLEFKQHSENLGVHGFYIVDSLINGNLRELERMCDLIIESGLKVWWSGKASFRRHMTKELLMKMAKAGCFGLDYGLESGSPKVISDMKKGFEIPVAERLIRETNEVGIKVGLFLLAGFPTETEDNFQETLDSLKAQESHIDHVTAGYGMGLQAGSDVQLHQEQYGIYWKGNDWYSEHTTPEIRRDRVERLHKYCSTLKFGVM
ncbi:MAG: radical SAM protein [Bdellovibrionales bacterium]|nr:radical SAM protein [Bdellovibrionales bacterium]